MNQHWIPGQLTWQQPPNELTHQLNLDDLKMTLENGRGGGGDHGRYTGYLDIRSISDHPQANPQGLPRLPDTQTASLILQQMDSDGRTLLCDSVASLGMEVRKYCDHVTSKDSEIKQHPCKIQSAPGLLT